MDNNKISIEKPLTLAIKYLSYQLRTIYEIKRYLANKGFNKEITKQVIKYLMEKNYLDDQNYAQIYIKTMVRNRPKSKYAISFALKKKGIDLSIAEPILMEYDDTTLAIKAVTPKIRVWKNLDVDKFKKKTNEFFAI